MKPTVLNKEESDRYLEECLNELSSTDHLSIDRFFMPQNDSTKSWIQTKIVPKRLHSLDFHLKQLEPNEDDEGEIESEYRKAISFYQAFLFEFDAGGDVDNYLKIHKLISTWHVKFKNSIAWFHSLYTDPPERTIVADFKPLDNSRD